MARDWEAWLRNATGPSSKTEADDRDRTEQSIRDAIAVSPISPSVRVYAKGSYANNTNVRRDSDVDVVVEWNDWSYIERVNDAASLSWPQLGVELGNSGPTPSEYRERVVRALVSHFGADRVDTSGTKAITVGAGSTTLDADVVPCFRYKRYFSSRDVQIGTRLFPTRGPDIIGWPEQQRENATAKNRATHHRYKQMIRALKRLENDMVDIGRLAEPVPGYFIECLLYNLPDPLFESSSSYATTAELLLFELYTRINKGMHRDWEEVNGLKWLWRDGQDWTPDQAKDFAVRGLAYLGER